MASPELLEEPDPGLEGHWADASDGETLWTIARVGDGWALRVSPGGSGGDMGITLADGNQERWAVATPFTLGGSHFIEFHADEKQEELFQIPVHLAVRYEVRGDSLLVDFVGAGEWVEWATERNLPPVRARHPRSLGCQDTAEHDCSWTTTLFTHPTPVLQSMLAEIMSDADVSREREVMVRVRLQDFCDQGEPRMEAGDLPLGGTVEGTLMPTDCLGPELEYRDFWTLVVDAPGTVRLELSSADFDAYVELQDATGAVVGSDDDGGEGTDSKLEVWLDAGRYRVVASTYGRGQRGQYSLSASPGGAR